MADFNFDISKFNLRLFSNVKVWKKKKCCLNRGGLLTFSPVRLRFDYFFMRQPFSLVATTATSTFWNFLFFPHRSSAKRACFSISSLRRSVSLLSFSCLKNARKCFYFTFFFYFSSCFTTCLLYFLRLCSPFFCCFSLVFNFFARRIRQFDSVILTFWLCQWVTNIFAFNVLSRPFHCRLFI